MATKNNETVEGKLDALIELMQQLLALELSRSGVSQVEIGKRVHVATATVGEMLKGVKKKND